MLRRTAEQSEGDFQQGCRVPEWELPVAEVVLQDALSEPGKVGQLTPGG